MDMRLLEFRWRPEVDEEDLRRREDPKQVVQMACENSLGSGLGRLAFEPIVLISQLFRASRCLLSLPSVMEPNLSNISSGRHRTSQYAQTTHLDICCFDTEVRSIVFCCSVTRMWVFLIIIF